MKTAAVMKGNKLSLILRKFVKKPSFGEDSFRQSKQSDIILNETVSWFLTEPNYLYYQPSQALTQIKTLDYSTKKILRDLDELHPSLKNLISVGFEDLTPRKKSLLGRTDMDPLSEIENPLKTLRILLYMYSHIYEHATYPTIRRGRGRPRNQLVHDTAEKVAKYHFHHVGRLPGTGTGIHLSPFQRCVGEVLKELKIKADSRRACESVLSKLRKKK